MKSVLIVDDMPDVRLHVRLMLKKSGINAQEAGSAAEALIKLQSDGDIGVMLLDLNMPDMSGFDVLRSIGDLRLPEGPKVCIMSGKSHRDDVAKAVTLGADDYLVKPLYRETLTRKVRSLLLGSETSEFASLKVNIRAFIKDSDFVPDLIIDEISEEGFVVRSTAAVGTGVRISIAVPSLVASIPALGESLICRVERCHRVRSGLYFLHLNFVGLRDPVLQSIRALTIRGKTLSYEGRKVVARDRLSEE